MTFNETMYQLSALIAQRVNAVENEEAVKMSLVVPLLQSLGYDVFNPLEVIPEYVCDIGIKKGERVDFAVFDGELPTLLIECKNVNQDLDLHINQLFRYYTTSNARIAILTNGVVYKFFADTERANIMDMTPFFEVDMTQLTDYDIAQLLKFHKSYFNPDYVCASIPGIRYVKTRMNQLTSIINLNQSKYSATIQQRENIINDLRGEIKNKSDDLLKHLQKIQTLQEIIQSEKDKREKERLEKERIEQGLLDNDLGLLIEYLNMPVPTDWHEYSIQKKKDYYVKRQWHGHPRDFFCTPEVACEFYGYEKEALGVKTGRFVAEQIRMTRMFVQTGKKKRFGVYGSALAWIRSSSLSKQRK